MEQQHFDIKRAPVLDSKERLDELRIDELLTNVADIIQGMTCVDLGCGTGTFSFPMVNHVGKEGTIYAVDDSADMLDFIKLKKPPPNLQLINDDAGQTKLYSHIADVCLLAFILHEVKEHDNLVNEAYRLLRTDSRVLVVEWKAELTPKGPPGDVRIDKDKLRQLLNQSGFADFRYIDWSINHYVAVCTK